MKVFIPTPLRSYTDDRSEVEAAGATLAEVLADLDRRYPGIRFRMVDEQDAIRRHIRMWVNKDEARTLDVAVGERDEVIIFQALSGGERQEGRLHHSHFSVSTFYFFTAGAADACFASRLPCLAATSRSFLDFCFCRLVFSIDACVILASDG